MNVSTKHIYCFLFLLVLFSSCKKQDELIEEKALLIGDWEWQKSDETVTFCSEGWGSPSNTLTPLSISRTHALSFKQEGSVEFISDGSVTNEYRIVFDQFEEEDSPGYEYDFRIRLDNSSSNTLYGRASADSLWLKGFPFEEDGCENYINYFLKQ